jgi:peptidyl-prolyl cis-trans isomerase-like 3
VITLTARVIDGADSTLDQMEKVPVTPKNRPTTEIKLNRITIHANPIADAHK